MQNHITFYCKPHVAQFLRATNGNSDCVRFPRGSNTKKLFLACLTKQFADKKEFKTETYTCQLTVSIRINDIHRFGNSVNPSLSGFINDVFDELITIDLFAHVTKLVAKKVKVDAAIVHFMEQYKLTSEMISPEALRMRYFRMATSAKNISCTSVTQSKSNV